MRAWLGEPIVVAVAARSLAQSGHVCDLFPTDADARAKAGASREVIRLVLVEAVGSSITPFVPVPFVDDYLVARLFRRITPKVAERNGQAMKEAVAKAIVEGYTRAGDPGMGRRRSPRPRASS